MKEQKKVAWGYAGKDFNMTLLSTYGINKQQWLAMWEFQERKCAGCRIPLANPWDRRAMCVDVKGEVDHDHVTGKVRGLLCRRCNDFLGKIHDNKETMHNLLEYLKRNGEII